jgi:hypothetical protein
MIWRKMGNPSSVRHPIVFHIYTEADECPHNLLWSEFEELFRGDPYMEDYSLSEKTNTYPPSPINVGEWENLVSDLKVKFSLPSESSGHPLPHLDRGNSFSVFKELAMWDLESLPCSHSFPTSCPESYDCFGRYVKKCPHQMFCESFPSGVWRVQYGRGDGYVPHEIYLHVNGQPENDIYCIGQGDIIWSPCSTFSHLSVFLSPLGKTFKIVPEDCGLPVEQQTLLLCHLDSENCVTTQNERVPVVKDIQNFKKKLLRWGADWVIPERNNRRAFGGYVRQHARNGTSVSEKRLMKRGRLVT